MSNESAPKDESRDDHTRLLLFEIPTKMVMILKINYLDRHGLELKVPTEI